MIINDNFGAVQESKPSNKDEIQWKIRRLENYMTPEDEPLFAKLTELLEDPFLEDIDDNVMKIYNDKVEEAIGICQVLDRFSIKKIESYMRKKKLDNLNNLNNNEVEMCDNDLTSPM